MRKHKLSFQIKALRKEVLMCYGKRFPAQLTAELPWQLLDTLIQDLPCLDSGLKSLLTEVSASRSITDYFLAQRFSDPQLYESREAYSASAAVLSFLKKYPFGKVAGLDPEGKAKQNFVRAEKLCRITNRRLIWYRKRGFRHKNRWQSLHGVFHTARLLISGWLGPLDLNTIYDYSRHGPGGAVGVTGDATTAYYKFAAEHYTATTRALPYAEAAILADPQWRRYVHNPEAILGDAVPSVSESRPSVLKKLRVVDYNKVTFVPKTAQTHRAIAIEPLMNIYLQLGVGDYMTDVLRRAGINLRSQTRNQNLARDGSAWSGEAFDRPATLDLSMASDTLSIELVRELLPESWYCLLDDLRSHSGSLDGKRAPWAKFSSMGNGFTFQLESMIFYALALSVAKHTGCRRDLVTVYGDDIICPASMALLLVDVLAYSGFRVNPEKSYITGKFRESCGTDWFEGRNTRPFFLKRRIQNAKDLVFILNSFGGLCLGDSLPGTNDLSYPPANIRRLAFDRIPKIVRMNLLGPRTEDKEGHIHAPWDYSQKSRLVLWNRDLYAWSYCSVRAQPLKYSGEAGPIMLQMLGRNSSRGSLDDVSGNNSSFVNRLLALEAVDGTASPGNSGDVTRRSSTKLRLATQTCLGWRND